MRALLAKLDFLDEQRLEADARNVVFKQRSEKYYNFNVKLRAFQVRDLMQRRATRAPTEVFGPT